MSAFQKYRTAEFRQTVVLKKYYPDLAPDAIMMSDRQAAGGICWALCAKWITRFTSHRGEKPAERIKWLKQEDNVVDAMQIQVFTSQMGAVTSTIESEKRSFLATLKQNNVTKEMAQNKANEFRDILQRNQGSQGRAREKALSYYGLTSSSLNLDDQARSPTDLAQDITRIQIASSAVHTYTLINIFGKTSGHGICCYQAGGTRGGAGNNYFFDPNFGEFKVPGDKLTAFYSSLLGLYDAHPKFGPLSRYQVFRIS